MRNPIINLKSSTTLIRAAEVVVLDELPEILPDLAILVGGKVLTRADVLAELRTHLALMTAAGNARAEMLQAIAAEKAQHARCAAMMKSLRAYAAAVLGVDSHEYAMLGFATAKPAELSSEAKRAAAAKRAATRVARKTKGKRQKAAIRAGARPAATRR